MVIITCDYLYKYYIKIFSIYIVTGYVYIESKPQDQSVIEGSDAVFVCNPTTPLTDSSRLHIRWKYKGRYINTSLPKYEVDPLKNTLLIKKVSLSDDGIYTCVATVGVDMDMKAAELKVKGKL